MFRFRLARIVLLVVPLAGVAWAGPHQFPLEPVRGVHAAIYDPNQGIVSPGEYDQRIGHPIWEATAPSGYYFSSMDFLPGGLLCLDWGDIAPAAAGGFAFSYGTDVQSPQTVNCTMIFYQDDNGWNSAGRTAIGAFALTGLPGADPAGAYNTWIITHRVGWLDLEWASDLDGDGLGDFSYAYWFPGLAGTHTGPVIAGDPNVPDQGPGMEDYFDAFVPTDPNDPNTDFDYYATSGFEPGIFSQFYLVLYNMEPFIHCMYGGPHGDWCADDIAEPFDCVVGLEDLAVLLAHYGTTSGATHNEGDLEGYDGDVDLADLAEMLAHYGDNCTHECPWPGENGDWCMADIARPHDCVVDLADLTVLLAHYGMTSGATRNEGDLEGDDGDVDLADLAEMLVHYGDDCNTPP